MADGAAYRVLARKYRPQTFDALIGQEAMVRTLGNAIASGRLAHAFILTGVRGVGKTTTARLIARALNCIGPDGEGGPTTDPCGVCDPCKSIAESRHPDVMEMDAASRTGVDDIREIIDGVQYAPTAARYKIYIVDEVHMLSKNAFNALLKTLEEPPAHVKFLFATTEIRKVPVTVMSRCQRFDLRRVEADTLVAHLSGICEKEGAEAEEAALKMIARAAEGSVRDSLSLLDQAIAHGGGAVTEAMVRDMLGLADRARVLDLTEAVLAGRVEDALGALRGQYDLGADAAVVIADMLDVIHWLTRLKVVPGAGTEALVSEAERTQGREMADKLAMPHLTRAWQMLLKGLGEVRNAPSPIQSAEMVLIRLAYAADLPTPAEAIKALKDDGHKTAPRPADAARASAAAPAQGDAPAQRTPADAPTAQSGATVLAMRPETDEPGPPPRSVPGDFEALVALFHAEREPVLATMLKDQVRLVAYRPGRLEINPDDRLPPDFARRVQACLGRWTAMDWQVVVSRQAGEASLREKELAKQARLREEALAHPLVKAVMEAFPGASLAEVRAIAGIDEGGDGAAPDRGGASGVGSEDRDQESER